VRGREAAHLRGARAAIATALLAIATVAAATGGDATTRLDRVVLQLKWTHQFQFAGYYAALEQGYFRDAGLDVVLREKTPDIDYVNEVVRGNAEFGTGESAELLVYRMDGAPLVILAPIFQHSPSVLIVKSDSGILGPQDMVGKRAAIGTGFESGLYLAVFYREGIPLSRIERVPYLHSLDDFVAGRVDVVAAYLTNWPYILDQQGIAYTIIHPEAYGLDFYGDCLFTTEGQCRLHPERTKAFRAASLRGWEYAFRHPNEVIALIRDRYAADTPHGLLEYEAEAIAKLSLPNLVELGHVNPGRWAHLAETFSDMGIGSADSSIEGFLYDVTENAVTAILRRVISIALPIFLAGAAVVAVLLVFNKRLKHAVQEQIKELSALNKELMREVKGHKKSQEALLESEERLDITLHSIGEGVMATDINGRVTLVNPVAERLTGYGLDESLGEPVGRVFRILDSISQLPIENPVDAILEGNAMTGRVSGGILVARDGAERQIACSAAPILNRSGESVGVVLVFRDVTERYRLEDQLRQSQKMEAIGQLAGGIAHDFNNLLGGIIGYADMLEARLRPDEKLHGFAQAVLDTAERASDLTKKLLAFSRKGKKRSEPVDVHRLIGEVISILQRTIDRRIVINQRLEALPSETSGDPSLLESALLNLAVNARDAMPEGGELLFTTSTVTLDEGACRARGLDVVPGAYIELAVKDTGIGMDRQTRNHVFEPFFTTKGAGEGTGLGLSAVFGTVKEHQGAISVVSEPGKGSAFTILLPVNPVGLKSDDAARADAIVYGRGRILVIDDEEVIRSLAHNMLIHMGYEVLLAQDGPEGIEIFQRNAPNIDLVVLDMVMPKLGGEEVLRAIKGIDPAAKVLISSGYSFGVRVDGLMAQGAAGFLQKPFTSAELSQHVAKAMGRRPARST